MLNHDEKKNKVKYVILGKIGSCYGVLGWMKLFSFTEIPQNIFNYNPWFVQKNDDKRYEIQLENWHYYKHYFIIKLKSIDNRNIAKLFTNCEVSVDSSILPQLKDGCYYWKDLIGCQVINIEGFNLGKVTDILETKLNDVLVVLSNRFKLHSKKELLIPFIDKHIVNKVNLVAKTIEVNWYFDF